MADDGMPVHLMNPISGAKGGGGQSRTPIEAPDSLYSTAMARIVDLLSEGEIEMWNSDNPLKDVFLDETPVMNADGSLNFQSVQVEYRTGTADQDPIPGFPSVQSEIGVGVELKQATPWVRAINNVQLSAVKIRLAVNSLSKTDNTNGDVKGYRVDYAIDLATDGGAYQEVFRSAFSGKTSTLYERTHRIDLPPATTGWNVRVRRLTADNTTAYISDTTVVQAITEIVDAKLRYPYSALVGISLDASQFRSIPRRAYRVKGRIIRVPVNYDPETRAYTGVWNGTFKLAWTTNPAWIYYDLVTNTRYGLGKRIPESRVDKWSLYRIAQYCDELVPDGKGGTEPRFQCTVYLQKQGDAFKVLRDLASVFRGIAFWSGGTVIAQADQPEDPVYTYTNANVKDGKFTYNGTGRKARHTVAMVAWSNPDNFGKGEIEPVIDDDGIIRYGIQTTNVTAFGTVSQSQAQRVGNWILKSELAETDAVSFDVGLDGTLVAPGKIIRIADQNRAGRRIGGRLSAVAADRVTVDAMPDPPPAPGDTLVTITAAGVAQEHSIHSVDVLNRVVVVTAPFVNQPVEQSVWAVESTELQTQLFRVLGITNGNDGISFGMSAIQHNPSKFAAVDNGTQLETRPTSILPSTVIQGPSAVTLTSVERAGEVISSLLLQASWTPVEGASYYMVQWKRDDADWTNPEKTQSNGADLANVFPGKWWARVWAVGINGISSPQVLSNQLAVADQSLKPGFVEQLNADIAEALETAENAQATADGAIVSFWQDSPPVIGSGAGQAKVGDIWFDTNDGNKIYRVVGSSWVDAQDDQLALALSAATTAQATADGKVKTFFQSTAPTATAIGDLWFNTTAGVKKLFRWNGSTWSDEIADVTLDQLGGNGINILPDGYSTFEATALPAMTNPLGLTLARDATNKVVSASLRATNPSGAKHVYLGASVAGSGLKLTPGKKYLVSAWANVDSGGSQVRPAIEVLGGTYYYGAYTAIAVQSANTFTRYSWIIDTSANTVVDAWLLLNVDGGGTYRFDGIMVEELIGRANVPSTYSRGVAAGVALSALIAAQNAQATADGQIDIYHQSSPPTIGSSGAKLGDYWQDSDDGKWWYCNGSTWVESTDNRLPQAVADAAAAQSSANTAQSTANARIRLFVQDATPAGGSYIVGDMWFRPSYKDHYYWNGTGWSKNQDTFEAATDSLVLNPSFEQADLYWNRDPGMYQEVNAAALSGSRVMVFSAAIGNPNARAVNSKAIQVRPGQVLSVIGCVGRWQNAANGEGAIGLVFYNKDGSYIGEKNLAWSSAPSTGQQANAYWRTVTGKITVPYGAVKAHANMIVTSCTSGFWVFDNIRLAFQDSEPRAVTNGENFVPNGNFGSNRGGFPLGQFAPIQGEFCTDGWVNDQIGGNYASSVSVGLEAYGSGSGQQQLFIGDAGGTASPGSNVAYIRTADQFAVEPGEKFVITTEGVIDIGNARPSGVVVDTYAGINCYNLAGGDIGYLGRAAVDYAGYWRTEHVVTIPAGTAYVRPIVGVGWANTTGANVTMPWATCHARFRQLNIRRQTSLDQPQIADGTTYGRTANQDLYDSGGVRRIGLNVKGSRKILGGARNIRSSVVAGAASVRTTTALSATSAGAVSVNAHSLELSGETVAFSAVSNAVTGLTQGVTYVIFTIDPYLDGGVRTYYAQTSVLSAQQAGDGCVFIGNVTIPTSGSSSGGGGGIGNPGDWCVDWGSVLPDGRLVRDLEVGELVECVDVRTGRSCMYPLQAIAFGEAECYALECADGAVVVQSRDTKMDLPDGRVLSTEHMLGEEVCTKVDGEYRFSRVRRVRYLGLRPVVKPDLGNRMFFAGVASRATVATHNVQYKP